ncbi:MAG TPA: DNA-binding domain-containing protein [Sphingomicrobium sp.]
MLPDHLDFQREFAALIDQPAQGPLAVYRNTVLHGAVEALRANYPVVEQIVGTEMFRQVAVDFATDCPPRRPVLVLYGDRFAGWLERQPWIGDLNYLPDVARVERLHVECLMSADAEPLEIAAVRATLRNSGSARLRIHPSARFDWLRTPAMSLWLAHQRHVASEISPDWKPEGTLFVRPSAFTVHALRIGPAAHRMMFGVRLGEPLDAAIAAATRLYPDEDCTAVLASLANLGLFAALTPERIH